MNDGKEHTKNIEKDYGSSSDGHTVGHKWDHATGIAASAGLNAPRVDGI